MEKQLCEVCNGKGYAKVKNSILITHYSFLDEVNLRACKKCGAKYMICRNCKNILNRVHISLDIFDLKVECSNCNEKDNLLIKWILANSS